MTYLDAVEDVWCVHMNVLGVDTVCSSSLLNCRKAGGRGRGPRAQRAYMEVCQRRVLCGLGQAWGGSGGCELQHPLTSTPFKILPRYLQDAPSEQGQVRE